MENVNIPNPPQVPPNNYLVFAILTTLFCFLPTGIVAIIYATKVNTLWHAQAYGEAYDASRKAKNWSVISAAVGALVIIVYVILAVAFAGSLGNAGY
ncbi:MAG: CD225/dispanin family protein [Muribaculaceae bacterium]|nr:CD225/dispanin family protein [Muribaculaceae bacterium]MDE6793236.1 CD225/dispanin family protein [Muribaculaceae bacterium]